MPNIPENSPLWLTILIFMGIGLIVFLQTRNTGKVQGAEATEKISGAYSQLMEDMRKQIGLQDTEIAELKTDVAYLKTQLKKYTNWSAQLMKQLIEHGIVPVDPPDTGELNKR